MVADEPRTTGERCVRQFHAGCPSLLFPGDSLPRGDPTSRQIHPCRFSPPALSSRSLNEPLAHPPLVLRSDSRTFAQPRPLSRIAKAPRHPLSPSKVRARARLPPVRYDAAGVAISVQIASISSFDRAGLRTRTRAL